MHLIVFAFPRGFEPINTYMEKDIERETARETEIQRKKEEIGIWSFDMILFLLPHT